MIIMKNNHLLILTFILVLTPSASFATDTPKQETPLGILEQANGEITKGLDENQLKQFSAIDNSYLIIRTVEDVQQSISRAVESCSKTNPDFKQSISGSFEAWKDKVRPALKRGREKLEQMILQQSFTQPSQVRDFLKKVDAAAIYRNQKIKPTPIEKLEDCQRLQKNMETTQVNLVALITENLGLDSELKVKE